AESNEFTYRFRLPIASRLRAVDPLPGERVNDPLFFVLAGDANRDRVVNLGDFLALREAFGTGLFFSQGDFNGDGSVDLNDFLILRANFNASVPAPTQFLFGSDGDGEDRGSLFA
ncbi:MAG: hypothetical protein AAGK78_14920, partial [Planctomycetota bacterium]